VLIVAPRVASPAHPLSWRISPRFFLWFFPCSSFDFLLSRGLSRPRRQLGFVGAAFRGHASICLSSRSFWAARRCCFVVAAFRGRATPLTYSVPWCHGCCWEACFFASAFVSEAFQGHATILFVAAAFWAAHRFWGLWGHATLSLLLFRPLRAA